MKKIDTLPKLPMPESTFLVDENISVKSLYKEHHIRDFRPTSDALRMAEYGNPEEVVKVTVNCNHEHWVGPDHYRYEAFKETTVPRSVAEVLEESGLLHHGGVSDSIAQKVKNTKENTRWTVSVPRDNAD